MKLTAHNIYQKIKRNEYDEILSVYTNIYESSHEVVYQIEKNQYVIVYTFGAYVLINLSDDNKKIITDLFTKKFTNKLTNHSVEHFSSKDLPSDSNSIKFIRIVSLVLAESVTLDYYEEKIDDLLTTSLKYSKDLATNGKHSFSKKGLIKFVGTCIYLKQEILNNLYINDYPDEVWDDDKLEETFRSVQTTFDIIPRYKAIEKNLDTIQSNLNILIELINNNKSTLLELIIIGLITFEIIMSLYPKVMELL